MKILKITRYIVYCSLVCHLFLIPSVGYAQVTLGEDIDCTDVNIDYSDDPTLTQEERLRLMDEAFFESLNKFEFCQSVKNKKEAAGNGQAGSNGGDEGDGGNGTVDSVASSTVSGTDAPIASSSAASSSGDTSNSAQSSQEINESGSKNSPKIAGANGKLPEDIPPAANDDVLAAQIRYAAENEKDPVKQKLLWDEYRKYKGLPPQK